MLTLIVKSTVRLLKLPIRQEISLLIYLQFLRRYLANFHWTVKLNLLTWILLVLFKKLFPGPQFGITGIREKIGVFNRPAGDEHL